jgi:transcriptional regulator with XRE-family HTH domain
MRKTEEILPPMTLRQMVDEAVRLRDLPTYESLAMHMGVHANTLYQWIEGKRLPTDESMLMLAVMADLLPMEALLLLNYWRATGRAKVHYMKWLRQHGYHYRSATSQNIEWQPSDNTILEAEIQRKIRTVREQIRT